MRSGGWERVQHGAGVGGELVHAQYGVGEGAAQWWGGVGGELGHALWGLGWLAQHSAAVRVPGSGARRPGMLLPTGRCWEVTKRPSLMFLTLETL